MSNEMRSGDVVVFIHGVASSIAGGVVIEHRPGIYVVWFAPFHRAYLGGTPAWSYTELTEQVRPASAPERDIILMKMVGIPVFEESTREQHQTYEQYIKPLINELCSRVQLIKCPGCAEMIPVDASAAQILHMETYHPNIIERRLRQAGLYHEADRFADGERTIHKKP